MDKLLEAADLSRAIAVSPATLRRWRATNQGPPFVRVGRQIRYSTSDVQRWLDHHRSLAGDAA